MVDGEPRSGAEAQESPAAVGAAGDGVYRDDVGGVVAGVAAGLGRHTGIDPVVWRCAFGVTALGAGTGVVLYAFAWLLMRDPRGGPAVLEQLLNRRLGGEAVLALLGAGLALGTLCNLVGGFGWTTLVLAVPLVLAGLVAHNRGVDLHRVVQQLPEWLRRREPPPSAPDPAPDAAYYNPAQPWAAAPSGPIDLAVVARQAVEQAGLHGAYSPAEEGDDEEGRPGGGAAKRSRDRGVGLLGFTAGAALVLTGAVFALSGGVSAGALLGPEAAPVYLGGLVALCGAALVVGTWVGNPRGLVPVASLVTVLAVAATATDLTQLRFGEVVWRPETVSEAQEPFELTAGRADLDLTGLALEPGQEVTVRAEVGLGSLDVLVPESVRITVRGRSGFGRLSFGERDLLGFGLDVRGVVEPESAPDADEAEEESAAEPPTLNLVLDSCAGDVEVRHVAA
mgnify:CR=1 FL=1